MKSPLIKIILSLLATLSLIACSNNYKDDDLTETNRELSTNSYELEEFSFHGITILDKDLSINAKTVYFRFNSAVKLNEFNLDINAKNVIFEKDSQIIAYYENEYNSCHLEGKNSGSITIETKNISGSPFLDLSGQNAGQIGFYSVIDAQIPLELSHAKIKNYGKEWFNGCQRNIRGYPKDVPEFLRPLNGGLSGCFYLTATNANEFEPLISERVSHSSYEALVLGTSKNGKLSWWQIVPRGVDGQKSKLCYFIEGKYLCEEP